MCFESTHLVYFPMYKKLYFILKMGPARDTILVPSLHFSLLTVCTFMVSMFVVRKNFGST
jgi:hypothetical protein